MTSHSLRLAALLTGLLGFLLPAYAAPIKFDIPAQATAPALKVFIAQSKAQVTYRAAELDGKTSREVKGDYEVGAAMNLLLEGTGFSAEQRESGIFVVTPIRPGSIEGSVRDEAGKPVAGAKVTMADSDQAVATDKRGRFVFAAVPAGSHVLNITADGLQNARVTDVTVNAGRELSMSPITIPVRKQGTLELETYTVSAKKNEGVVELDPYAVSGVRAKAFTTANIDLMRTPDDVLPFNVFSARQIEQSGAPDLASFLKSNLSQVTGGLDMQQQLITGANNPANSIKGFSASQIGLMNGAGSTISNPTGNGATEIVVLVNGRRLPERAYGSEEIVGIGNFNAVPVGSIERIEFLTAAAGAIYGAGANGAVVNIITKKAYTGGSLRLSYESPADAHAPKRSIDASYAMTLRPGLTVRANVARNESRGLPLGERSDVTVDRIRAAVMAKDPLRFGTPPPLGATTNISVFTPDFAVDYFTSVPAGYSGGQGIAPFATRRNVYNLELPDTGNVGPNNYGKKSTLGPARDVTAFAFSAEQTLGSRWTLGVDVAHESTVISGIL